MTITKWSFKVGLRCCVCGQKPFAPKKRPFAGDGLANGRFGFVCGIRPRLASGRAGRLCLGVSLHGGAHVSVGILEHGLGGRGVAAK